MVDAETKKKLAEAISLIENTAQNQQTYDTVPTNEWDIIETEARDLREKIEELETPEEYQARKDADAKEKEE